MDWARAKTILIVAYVALNTVLCVRLIADPGRASASTRTLPRAEAEAAKQEARENGIEIGCAIPRKAPAMSLLVVSKTEEKLGERMLERGAKPSAYEKEGKTVYEAGQERVTAYENGVLVYEALDREQSEPFEFDENEAVSIAKRFWEERVGLPRDCRLDSVLWEDRYDAYGVNFCQQHQGKSLFSGRRYALVSPQGVTFALLSWFEVVGQGQLSYPVLTAAEALRALYSLFPKEASEEAAVLKDVSLGYFTEAYNARRWEAVPVWRFGFEGGDNFYVNAYTGRLESGGFDLR